MIIRRGGGGGGWGGGGVGADYILKCIFFNENAWISIKISLKFVTKGSIDNKSALVHIMA